MILTMNTDYFPQTPLMDWSFWWKSIVFTVR